MFKFITRQSFIVNLLVAVALVLLMAFIFFQSLGWITNHGDYLKVPSVTGQNVDDAVRLLEKQGFEVVITDSLYNDSLALNKVKKQLPDANATVKVNRTVFLNVNPRALPMVEMPKLVGLSYRFAADKLNKTHLKVGDTTNRPDFMRGSVLEQHYDGKEIEAGSKVKWGSAIDLVVGGGLQAQKIPVPDLRGLTVTEAREILKEKGILLAAILTTGTITDTASAFVYKQNPEVWGYNGELVYIQPGQTLDIWIQLDRPAIDSLPIKTDTLKIKKP